jgi:uncharacterized protein YndB with AHSA1/START domain
VGDYHIQAQIEIGASPIEVRRWLESPEGIAGWWSDSVAGAAAAEGDRFEVRFPTTDVVFQLAVTDASPERIEWRIAENPPWWKGTTIRFDLVGEGEGTRLLFSHRDFDPDNPVIPVITPAWMQFLFNLKAVAESGEANPAVIN